MKDVFQHVGQSKDLSQKINHYYDPKKSLVLWFWGKNGKKLHTWPKKIRDHKYGKFCTVSDLASNICVWKEDLSLIYAKALRLIAHLFKIDVARLNSNCGRYLSKSLIVIALLISVMATSVKFVRLSLGLVAMHMGL